jgi:alcohol dehydrogenase class IV
LEHVINFNYDSAPDRYGEIAGAMGIASGRSSQPPDKNALIEKIKELKKSVGITKTLGAVGVSSCDIGTLARNAHNDPCLLTNPKRASVRDLEVIYEEAM